LKRIFIAVKIVPGPTLLKIIHSLKAVLANDKINWVNPDNIHLTLAFLGDTEEERIKALSIMLKRVCTGFGDLDFKLVGTGIFRDFRDPRVLWAGIEGYEKLLQLNDVIKTGLNDTGFHIEERPFKPHITIGRIKFLKNPESLKSALAMYKDNFIQDVRVEEVILYQSILRPEGPFYKSLGAFKLK
jgi:2'-5' RNA ligase